jgi:REP element-mobilizing transposase RayT
MTGRSYAKTALKESRELLTALMDWRVTLRPEVVKLQNWPKTKPELFLKKRLWQTDIWDHVIRNDVDLQDNINYIVMNPVREGYVSHPQFYPYTGFCD